MPGDQINGGAGNDVVNLSGGGTAVFTSATMLNVETLLALSASAWELLREGMRPSVRNAAPQVATYVAAAGLLASALGMWWWAERRLTF